MKTKPYVQTKGTAVLPFPKIQKELIQASLIEM